MPKSSPLSLALLLCAAVLPACGQAPDLHKNSGGTRPQPAPHVSDSISVTSAEPLPIAEPGRSTVLFDRIASAEAPLFHSPVDYLRLDPSVVLGERSPAGVQADLSIRGTTFEQTLVLVDGLRVNDPETGHLNFDLTLPLEAMQRIDVLHGSGSTFYGSDAIGGAVNLITFAPEQASATLSVGGGNLHSTEQHLSASWLTRSLAQRLSASRDTSDGFFYRGLNDRGFHSSAVALDSFLTTPLASAAAPTEILLGASDRPFGANRFYGAAYDAAERTKGWFASIRQPLPLHLTADFAYRRHTDLFILKVSNPDLYRNNHIATLWQADLRYATTFRRSSFTLASGLEADGDAIQSSNLGRHARNQGAGYATLGFHFKRLTLSAGAREEIFRGPLAVFSPSAAVALELGRGLRIRAAAGHGFRLPTYLDLYYSDPTTLGNPALQPETSQSYEGGLDFARGRTRLFATGFTLRQTNAIDYAKSNPADRFQAVNVGHIALTGVESGATQRLRFADELTLGYTFLHAAPPPPGLLSKYAYTYASNNASFAYQVRLGPELAARTQVSVVQQTAQPAARTAYPLWTVALTRTRGFVRPFLRAENLSNTAYQEIQDVPGTPRAITAGITFAWPRR